MKSVAIITHYDLSVFRGGEKFVIYLANSLAREGFKVTIYSLPFKKGIVNPKRYLVKDVKYVRTFFVPNLAIDTAYYIYAPLIHRILIRDRSTNKIAGLHGYITAPELSSKELWNISLPKYLITHGLKATIAYYYLRLFKEGELRSFQTIHVINPFTLLSEHLRKKVIYIPLWTEYKRTLPIHREVRDEFTVLMLGTNSYLKGRDICETIVRYFSKKEYFKTIFLCNNGSLDGYKHVKPIGFIPEERMPKLLSSVHVVLYPSRLDTFGMTIIEALNCGVPVVTSDILAHKVFGHPVFLCKKISEYIKVLIYLYKTWKEGYYHLIRMHALKEGARFTKDNVFPFYKKLFAGGLNHESC